jgi:hypothetical protein
MVLCLKLGSKTINKTQLLSALKTFILQRKHTEYIETKLKYLSQYKFNEQVPPEMENRKFSACFISGDTFTLLPYNSQNLNTFYNI